MKKITYICDNCKKEISTDKVYFNDELPRYLMGVGYQEWCAECIDALGGTAIKQAVT